MAEARQKLVPARPASAEESAAYMPRVPWRLIVLGTLSLATVSGGYYLTQRRKAEALRAQILQVHEQELAEPKRRYFAYREKLEGLIVGAASRGKPESYADERLRIPGLRSGQGLYLRLTAKDAATAKGIARGAKAMEGDAIASCLGLTPASARGLWEKGDFLDESWAKRVRNMDSVMELRVTDTVLARHLKADLPAVLNMLRSDWFLLVLEQGQNRRDDPVDVFLWDLRSGDELLRGRIQAVGVLFAARIQSKDAPPSPKLPDERREAAAATDCSIAAQMKQLAGMPPPTVENTQPVPVPASAPAAKPATEAAAGTKPTEDKAKPAPAGEGAPSETAPASAAPAQAEPKP
jgi:hypothetical protein